MDRGRKRSKGLLGRSHSINELFTCPVCMEFYQDPRILNCGHHFCKVCLDGIYSKSARFGQLKCPTCRVVTSIQQQSHVDNLPRPVIINELQQMILNMVEAKAAEQPLVDKSKRLCDLCDSNDTKTDDQYYCFNCQKMLCLKCNSIHKNPAFLQEHYTEKVTPELYCESHCDQTTSIYCHKCNCFCCIQCLVETHSEHNVEDILRAAEASRHRLDQFIQSYYVSSYPFISSMKSKVQKVGKRTKDLKQSITSIRDLLKNFDQKLKCVEQDLDMVNSAAMQTAVEFGTVVKKMEAVSASGEYLLDFANYLKTKAPLFDLIKKENDFEPPVSEISDSLGKFTMDVPLVDTKLTAMIGDIQKMMTNVCIEYNSEPIGVMQEEEGMPEDLEENGEASNGVEHFDGGANQTLATAKPLTILSPAHSLDTNTDAGATNDIIYHKVATFSLKHWVHGMALETNSLQLLVRTEDKQLPVKIYPYFGKNLSPSSGFGKWVEGLDSIGRIVQDTRRSLILAPCGNQIVRMDQGGYVMDLFKVGIKPRGVAYSAVKDLYVVTDVSDHKVYVVDPNTKKVVRSFGSKGVGNHEFQSPLYVHVNRFSEPQILISDSDNNCVKLFDFEGNYIKSYGQPGHADGQLWDPRGICTDAEGHVYVCDHKNRRLVKFWTENQQERWQCVLSAEQLCDQPFDVAIDQTNSIVALQLGKCNVTVELYKFHKSSNLCDIC